MRNLTRTQAGFSLIEFLVAMAISGMILATICSVFRAHNRMAVRQAETALMQQELLAATSLIADELRMCGYSPTGAKGFGFAHRPDVGKPDFGRATNDTSVYCTLDSRGDATLDESGSGSMRDHVGFRLNVLNSGASKADPDNVLRKYDTGAVRWQPQCTNIGEIRFTYFDAKGAVLADPGENTDRIRAVEISITAVPSKDRADFGIGNRTMTTRISCRNLEWR